MWAQSSEQQERARVSHRNASEGEELVHVTEDFCSQVTKGTNHMDHVQKEPREMVVSQRAVRKTPRDPSR